MTVITHLRMMTLCLAVSCVHLAAIAQEPSKVKHLPLKTQSNIYDVAFVDNYATIKHEDLPLPTPQPEDALAYEFHGESLNRDLLTNIVLEQMHKHRNKIYWNKINENFFIELVLYVHPVTKHTLYASFTFNKDNFKDLTFFEDLEKELQSNNKPVTKVIEGSNPRFRKYGYFRSGTSLRWVDFKDKLKSNTW